MLKSSSKTSLLYCSILALALLALSATAQAQTITATAAASTAPATAKVNDADTSAQAANPATSEAAQTAPADNQNASNTDGAAPSEQKIVPASKSPALTSSVTATAAAITTDKTSGASANTTTPAANLANTPANPALPPALSCTSTNTVTANIVALDQPFMLNRLGASMPQGMVFALARDIVPINPSLGIVAGNVMLRASKRPRPIALRVNQGSCLQINFTNLLNPGTASPPLDPLQPVTRQASVHVNGMPPVTSIKDNGAYVGKTPPGTTNFGGLVSPYVVKAGSPPPTSAPPTGQIQYTLYAAQVGTYLLYTTGSTFGDGSPDAGAISDGLFGAVNVERKGAEWYRSQVTSQDMLCATKQVGGVLQKTALNQPLINYSAKYDPSNPNCPTTWPDGTRIPAGTPVLKMLSDSNEIVNVDLTAIITGPKAGNFPATGQPEQAAGFGPTSPARNQPWREFTIIYHEVQNAVQAFPEFYPPPADSTAPDMSVTLKNGQDNFAINYGTGGIGAEIWANRIKVGPMANCIDCKFEEFFLSSWAVGDPAMVVDIPANAPTLSSSPLNIPNQPNQASGLVKDYEAVAAQTTSTFPAGSTPPLAGTKATVAFYPDDPSNVYHSYLDDHVTFHILNAGAWLTHIHHQHAQQWLHTPNDPNSSYLDSQLISPGAGFSLEIVYNGSGNRNKTIGDSIFHCHFYPHFAAGMWSLWRVHDVFESGTTLQSNGMPAQGSRALPDGEIAAGTPIPAVVPIPTIGMAMMPSPVFIAQGQANCGTPANPDPQCQNAIFNPGYPFFVPGKAGNRAPHPPMDFAYDVDVNGQKQYYDGGLPRHLITGGTVAPNEEKHNQWDFTKNNDTLIATQLPENGTPVERLAMKYFGQRSYSSFTPTNQPAPFITNGLPRGPQQGAPFADPGVDDSGAAVGKLRIYKAAVLQMNVLFNKKGYHYPQERFITLWGDVASTVNGTRPPEPLFFRANSEDDIVQFWHTNLVPAYYELDDFQVRTPTDIIAQHIHLVKFDVLASDGAANGFNYEDGTFSPDEVRDRIAAIRKQNKCSARDPRDGTFQCPIPKPAPLLFGAPPAGQNWTGAQTTVQRWYADPLRGCKNAYLGCAPNSQNDDRTLRTVFTHDHFGPSTHQQAGIYAGLLIEPKGSIWRDMVSGQVMGSRSSVVVNGRTYPLRDGGPTSWQANIETGAFGADSYREFALEFQDLTLAYNSSSITTPVPYTPYVQPFITATTPKWGWADCANAIKGGACPKSGATGFKALAVQPALITGAQGIGTNSVNYRNEPLDFRVNPNPTNIDPNASPNAVDLSFSFASIARTDADLNTQPSGAFPGAGPYDPFTPLLRAYQNDRVQVRVLVGGYLFQHTMAMHGLKWLFEPSSMTSGFRDNQPMGISEHFEMLFTVPVTTPSAGTPPGKLYSADYLYMNDSGAGQLMGNSAAFNANQARGMWGLLRSFNTQGNPGNLLTGTSAGLKPLPNNPQGGVALAASANPNYCTAQNATRKYNVAAINTLPGSTNPLVLTYNNRNGTGSSAITNPNALVYVLADSKGNPLNSNGQPLTAPPTAPLVLRANAGECISVTLFNNFNPVVAPLSSTPTYGAPSSQVGLHPQLVSYDVTQSNGANIGCNGQNNGTNTNCSPFSPATSPTYQTAAPGKNVTYNWYAGVLKTTVVKNVATITPVPVEFGAVNLMTSDPVAQQSYSLIGSLIIEPTRARWCRVDSRGNPTTTCSDKNIITDTTVDVTSPSIAHPAFREFVAMMQNNLLLSWGPSQANSETAAVNFGTEPMDYRFNYTAGSWNSQQIAAGFSNNMTNPTTPPGGAMGDPQTPVFLARACQAVRFRVLHPDGTGGFPDSVWMLEGHAWQEEPFINDAAGNPSAILGNNPLSQWMGSRDGFGPGMRFDMLIDKAGGPNCVQGDYLYKSVPSQEFPFGLWGVFRVCNPVTGCSASTLRSTTTTTTLTVETPEQARPTPPPSKPNNFDRFKPIRRVDQLKGKEPPQ